MSFPLNSFRAEILRKVGFDPFVNDILDDRRILVALMIPRSFYETPEHRLFVEYIVAILAGKKWQCNTSWHTEGVYENAWCGSRHTTHILGPHVLLELVYDETLEPLVIPPIPTLPNNWTIAEVIYDTIRNSNSRIATHTYAYEAAFPQDFMAVSDTLKQQALAYLAELGAV